MTRPTQRVIAQMMFSQATYILENNEVLIK